MRVGVYLSRTFPEGGGGYTFENEILQSLATWGPESNHTFVVFGWTKQPTDNISDKNIQFIDLQRGLKERLISKLLRILSGVLRKIRHSRSPFSVEKWIDQVVKNSNIDVFLYFNTRCLTLDVPYITIVWDLQHRLQPYFPEVSIRGEWDRRERDFSVTLQRASIVISGTEAGKAEIERFYQVPPERIKILPHPTPRFALEAALSNEKEVLREYNLPEGYLFYPAQFWSHKNHAALLRAIRLLRERYGLVFPLVLVGSDAGNQKYVMQLTSEFGLSNQVHFLGFVPLEDLVLLYREAFALVYVSLFGPENLPPLEAFALGCPVIASNAPGAREQMGDAALLVDARDEEEIALAIKSLHDDPCLRQTLVKRGLGRASRSTGETFIKGIFTILDEFEPVRRCWGKLR